MAELYSAKSAPRKIPLITESQKLRRSNSIRLAWTRKKTNNPSSAIKTR